MMIPDWPSDNLQDMIRFYGNPDRNGDGAPDVSWETENIVRIKPPYEMVWSWGPRLTALRVHRRCSVPLEAFLTEIGQMFTAKERRRFQLDRCGGGYHFRAVRGGNRLSTHAFGAAIDLAPELNPLGVPWTDNGLMMPIEVVHIARSLGMTWGGQWRRPDAMHFQFAR